MMVSSCCHKTWEANGLPGDCLITPTRRIAHGFKKIIHKELESKNFLCAMLMVAYKIFTLCLVLPFFILSIPFALIGIASKNVAGLCMHKALQESFEKEPLEEFEAEPNLDELLQAVSDPDPIIIPSDEAIGASDPLKQAKEDTFFTDINGIFKQVIAPLLKTQINYDFAVHICLCLLSLDRQEGDRAIIEELLQKFDWSSLNAKAAYKGKLALDNQLKDTADQIINICILFYEKRFGESFTELPGKISTEILTRLLSWFHGTSAMALKNIQMYGLSRIKRCTGDNENIQKITTIANEFIKKTFKFYSEQTPECIFVTQTPFMAWKFAKRSPEWLASFFESMSSTDENTDSHFFADNRDKTAAMQAVSRQIITLIKSDSISLMEAQRVRDFALKYWERYATNDSGVVLVVDRPPNLIQNAIDSFHDKIIEKSPEEYRQALVERLKVRFSLDEAGTEITDYDFEPQQIKFFRIPFHI